MKRTNKKQCPNCGSSDVFDTGSTPCDVEDVGPNGKYHEPDLSTRMSIYKCNDCNREFVLIEAKG